MSSPQQELLTLQPGAIVPLYEIDLSPIGVDTVVRFCNARVSRDRLSLNGTVFEPWPIEAEGFEASTDGPLPEPRITVSNYNSIVSALLLQYKPNGATVRRRRILAKHLDNGSDPRPIAEFDPEEYILDRWDPNTPFCTLYLSTSLAYLNLEIPGRRIIALRRGE